MANACLENREPKWVWYLTGKSFTTQALFLEFMKSQGQTKDSIRAEDTFTGANGAVYKIGSEEAMLYIRDFVKTLDDNQQFFPVWFISDYSVNKLGEMLRHSTGSVSLRLERDAYQKLNTNIKGVTKTWQAHRLMYLSWGNCEADIKGLVIDHINRQKNDNSFKNLRVLTNTENCRNIDKRYHNDVKLESGVYVHTENNNYIFVKIKNFDQQNNRNLFRCGFSDIATANACSVDIYSLDKNTPSRKAFLVKNHGGDSFDIDDLEGLTKYLLDTYGFNYVPNKTYCEMYTTSQQGTTTVVTMNRSGDSMEIKDGARLPLFFRAGSKTTSLAVSIDKRYKYAYLKFNGKKLFAHMVVAYLTGVIDSMNSVSGAHFVVHHKNGIRGDYSPKNLEPVSRRVNAATLLVPSKPRIDKYGKYYFEPQIQAHKIVRGSRVTFASKAGAERCVKNFHKNKKIALKDLAVDTLKALKASKIPFTHETYAEKELELIELRFTKETVDSWCRSTCVH